MKGTLTMAKKPKATPPELKKLNPRSPGPAETNIGQRIRLRRVEMNVSQYELAQKLGVSFQQVQKYEKGVNRVGAARLQQIAAALDVPITHFYDSQSKGDVEVQSLMYLDSKYTLRLLRAYTAIDDPTVQRQFVSLMERVAGTPPPREE